MTERLNKVQNAAIILSVIGGLIFWTALRLGIFWALILVSPFLIAVFILTSIMVFKPKYCEKCNTKLPILRKPENKEQAMYGGWTCPNCKAELDSSGKVVKKKNLNKH